MEIIKKVLCRIGVLGTPESEDQNDMRMLSGIPALPCNVEPLRGVSTISLADILLDGEYARQWEETCADPVLLAIPDVRRAVNPGDRRALHYMMDHFRPKRILEVGTHIGASTAWMASLLKRQALEDGVPFSLTSVDVKDVNCEQTKYWLKFGADCSPAERMSRLGVSDAVRFIASDSLEYLRETPDTYDFVFLDGNHRASHVYREIPHVLDRLSPGGVVLLHDYCPDGKILWNQEPVIIGPYEAVKRHQQEGKKLVPLPLGALPWETKYGSRLTSLAMLLKDDR